MVYPATQVKTSWKLSVSESHVVIYSEDKSAQTTLFHQILKTVYPRKYDKLLDIENFKWQLL